jgi:hypothetical protein
MKVSANGRSHLVSYSVPIGKVHILGMQFSSSRSSDSIPWVWTGGVLRRLWVSVRGEHPKNGAGCPVVWCEKNMREGMIHVLSSKTVGPPEFPVYQFLVCFWFSIHRIWKNIITFSRMEHWHNKHIFETTHLKRNPNMKRQCMKAINSSRWFGNGMFVNSYSTIPGIVVPNLRTCSLIMVDRSR